MKIISRYDAESVLWEGECDNVHEELVAAIKGGADLRGAYLRGADLGGAYLGVNVPPMDSHAFWAELLLRAAGDDLRRRMVAGLVAVSTDWCWPRMLKLIAGELAADWQEWAGLVFWQWPEQCRGLGLPEVVELDAEMDVQE
jgi:hypothetical protein